MSHEQIRQKTLQVQEVDHSVEEEKRKKVNGIHTPLQNNKKENREVKVGRDAILGARITSS